MFDKVGDDSLFVMWVMFCVGFIGKFYGMFVYS